MRLWCPWSKNMKTILALLCGLLLLTATAWAADSDDNAKDKSKDDHAKASNHLDIVGGSYFGTGDEFLYSGVSADPGAVVPLSVSEAGPGSHLHGPVDLRLPTDAEYRGNYDLNYYGRDNVVGPMWGAPGEELGDNSSLAATTIQHLQLEFDPADKTDGIQLLDDGRIVVFQSDAGRYESW